MKALLRLVVGLSLAACVATARAELSPVPFVLGKQEFKPGDAIIIEQVLASSPDLKIGTKVVVRGHYRLVSEGRARLGLFVTHPSPAGPDYTAPSQTTAIKTGAGQFELSCEIAYEGAPHVSFYPPAEGEQFGGIYFSAASKAAPY